MRLLVIRTSAMGDVALTVPVLKGMRDQFPDVELVLLTRPAFAPFFRGIDGITLIYIDLGDRHKGFAGIIRLVSDIKKDGKIDYVIDLHDVLRSQIIRALFRLSGVKTAVINKGREEKRAVIEGKIRTPIKHSVERYCDAFATAGFAVKPSAGPWIIPSEDALLRVSSMVSEHGKWNIGVAPYAKHKLKMWPEEKMKRLLELIAEKNSVTFWLFGGLEDMQKLESLQSVIKDSHNLAGKLTLEEELAQMSRLDLMIAMDSSNMHMAALTGTKVISIWGGTDPVTGFGAWMQPINSFVRIPAKELSCRPCTVFGKGDCRRGDFACMNNLTPEMVFESVQEALL
jgi:ADP-heptose:LPS heptosyltransferase